MPLLWNFIEEHVKNNGKRGAQIPLSNFRPNIHQPATSGVF
jgi:hypothetical protein